MALVPQQTSLELKFRLAVAVSDSFLTCCRALGHTALNHCGTACKGCMLMLELAAAGLE